MVSGTASQHLRDRTSSVLGKHGIKVGVAGPGVRRLLGRGRRPFQGRQPDILVEPTAKPVPKNSGLALFVPIVPGIALPELPTRYQQLKFGVLGSVDGWLGHRYFYTVGYEVAEGQVPQIIAAVNRLTDEPLILSPIVPRGEDRVKLEMGSGKVRLEGNQGYVLVTVYPNYKHNGIRLVSVGFDFTVGLAVEHGKPVPRSPDAVLWDNAYSNFGKLPGARHFGLFGFRLGSDIDTSNDFYLSHLEYDRWAYQYDPVAFGLREVASTLERMLRGLPALADTGAAKQ